MPISKEKFKNFVRRDLDDVVQELCLKEGSYERILKIAVSTADERITRLAAALGAADWPTAQKIFHDLKGMFANFRIAPLSQMALTMEREAAGKNEDGLVWQNFEVFSKQFQEFKDVFENVEA
ncbi:MAG: Hpt domain-containing protein [Candidatus Omnitrophica bacterium]|nr:Hpt domain-containing protein [Candidatus Omnitrophota bacterium]